MLKITVLDQSQAHVSQSVKTSKPAAAAGNGPPPNFTYNIRLELIRNSDKAIVWTYYPDRWTSYSDYQKSIKWLARYSAKQIERQGLLRKKYLQ
jgi:hypothetical protein